MKTECCLCLFVCLILGANQIKIQNVYQKQDPHVNVTELHSHVFKKQTNKKKRRARNMLRFFLINQEKELLWRPVLETRNKDVFFPLLGGGGGVVLLICYSRSSINSSRSLDVERRTRRPFFPQQFTATQRTGQSHHLTCRANTSGETGLHAIRLLLFSFFGYCS